MPWLRAQPIPANHDAVPDSAGADVAPSDAAIVAAARVDRRAFRPLYERYLRPVHRFCYLRTGSWSAADDLTSEVFVRALAGLERFRGDVFAGWLFGIARNVIADDRRRRRQQPFVVPIEAASEIMDPEPLPEEIALSRTLLETVRGALQTLPHDQRATIELQLAGLSTPEIAAALDRSQGAVRMLRLRAYEQLRPILEHANMASRREGLQA